jgi:hypothetical protein
MLFSGWGTRFFDCDNDCWKNLFVAQGHLLDNVDKTAGNLQYEQPPLLLHNVRGKFVRASLAMYPRDAIQSRWYRGTHRSDIRQRLEAIL